MNTQEILTGAQSAMTARRVFGDPVEVRGVTILPVATIGGGGGGGQRGSEESGVGFGIGARPAGVYVIRDDGSVTWRPALNLNLVILGGQIVGLAAILSIRSVLKAWARRPRNHHQIEPVM
ncbi:MAG TPA: hypothetical protein VH417_05525 [Vicinamibacterales bacterium]|jgi:hypothetical protein